MDKKYDDVNFIGPTIKSLIKESNTQMWSLLFDKYATQSYNDFYTNLTYTIYCLSFDMHTANILTYNEKFLKELNLTLDNTEQLYRYQIHFDNMKFQFLDTAVRVLNDDETIIEKKLKESYHFQTTNLTQQNFDLYHRYIKDKLNDENILKAIQQQKEITIEALCHQNIFPNTKLENWIKQVDQINGWQELGPLYWLWFHLSTAALTITKKYKELKKLLTLFIGIDAFIACSICELHFSKLKPSIKHIYQKNNKDLCDTLIEIHNLVTQQKTKSFKPLSINEHKLLYREYQNFWTSNGVE